MGGRVFVPAGVYIALDVGPRPLMSMLMPSMAVGKTVEEPRWTVNAHHSNVRRYNMLGTSSVDLNFEILGCFIIESCSTLEEDFRISAIGPLAESRTGR
ncbi:hypothetical protein L195_g048753, partial [Trifolium pratense]